MVYRVIRDAILVTLFSTLVAFVGNAIREDGLAWVAQEPYEIFVPCPETVGAVEGIEAGDPRIVDSRSFIIDARSEAEYDAWHIAGALHVEYDYFEPIPEEQMRYISRNILSSGMARVIVYGDGEGDLGSTGHELGRELAGRGIQNVFVIKAHAEKLQEVYP